MLRFNKEATIEAGTNNGFSERISFGIVQKIILDWSDTTLSDLEINENAEVNVSIKDKTGVTSLMLDIKLKDLISITREKYGLTSDNAKSVELDLGNINLENKDMIVKVNTMFDLAGQQIEQDTEINVQFITLYDDELVKPHYKKYEISNDDTLTSNIHEMYLPNEDRNFEAFFPDGKSLLFNAKDLAVLKSIYTNRNYEDDNTVVTFGISDNFLPIASGLKVFGESSNDIIIVQYIFTEKDDTIKREAIKSLVARRKLMSRITPKSFTNLISK